MDIVKQLRMYPYEYTRKAADEIENLRREAHTWSKACEAATTELYKLKNKAVSDMERATQITDEEHDALICDAIRYRWLRRNSGYTIRCNLFGEVGMHEHKDADLDAAIDAAMDSTPNACGCREGECESKPRGCRMADEVPR